MFGLMKSVGNVYQVESKDHLRDCYWLTLRFAGMKIAGDSTHFFLYNNDFQGVELVEWFFPDPLNPILMLYHVLSETKHAIVEMRDADPLRLIKPHVEVGDDAFVFAFNEDEAIKAAYEAGLRSTPMEWQRLSYYEFQKNKPEGYIPGE